MLPANVSFASGTAANYAVSYSPGRLVVLPRPPLVGESNAGAEGGNTGQVGIGETEEIKAAKSRAEEELRRVAVLTGSGPTVPAGRGRQPAPVGEAPTPSQLGMLLSGDGQRITLPELYKLPLITLDPLLRRLMQADGAR